MASKLSETQINALRSTMTDQEKSDFLFLDVQDPPGPVLPGIAFVFGNADLGISGKRAAHAANLYQRGLAQKVLLSGRGRLRQTEADFMAGELRKQNIPTNDLIIENNATITRQNFSNSSELLKQSGLLSTHTRIFLVSCPWHMCRVVRYAIDYKALFPNSEYHPSPHGECCDASTWTGCAKCRQLVDTELMYALRDCARGPERPVSRNYDRW